MKRIFCAVVLIFVLFLSACGSNDLGEPTFQYNAGDFTVEINSEEPDFENLIESNYDVFEIDSSEVDYSSLGTYTVFLNVDDETYNSHQLQVTVVDTVDPVIVIPNDFQLDYGYGEGYTVEDIVVEDNSDETLVFSHRLESTMVDDQYRLILAAEDSSGNETEEVLLLTWVGPAIPNGTIEVSNVTYNSFDIDVTYSDPDEIIKVRKIEIYEGVNFLRTVVLQEDQTVFSVTDVRQNKEYEFLYILEYELDEDDEYVYIFNDCTTLQLAAPSVVLNNFQTNEEDLSVDVSFDDPEGLLEDVVLYIIDKETTMVRYSIEMEEEGTAIYAEFLNNHEYRIEARYHYDISDGRGLTDDYNYEQYKSEALQIPGVNIESSLEVITPSTYLIPYTVSDVDGTIERIEFTIYNHSIFGDETSNVDPYSSQVYLGLLDPDTVYAFDIVVYYDLNDGLGERNVATWDVFETEVMAFEDFSISEDTLNADDTFAMDVKIDNPGDYAISGFKVNGVRFNVYQIVTQYEHFSIENTAENFFGNKVYELEGVYYMDEEEEKFFPVALTDSVDIRGYVEVTSIETDMQPGVYDQDDIVGFYFNLYNPLEYEIVSMTVDGTMYTGEDLQLNKYDNTITIDIDVGFSSGARELHVDEIQYKRGLLLTVTRNTYSDASLLFNVEDYASFIEITTALDFTELASNTDGNFRLMNDIDMSTQGSLDWGAFNGTLDGNGYSVSNLSTNNLSNTSGGLFSNFSEQTYIYDLNLIDMDVNMESFEGALIGGALVGDTLGAVIDNVYISGTIYAHCMHATMACAVGGLAGDIQGGYINDITLELEIELFNPNDDMVLVGGLAANIGGAQISNIHLMNTIGVSSYGRIVVGGLVGLINGASVVDGVYANTEMIVNNATQASIGGIIGESFNTTIINAYSTGFILVSSTRGNYYVGGIAGDVRDVNMSAMYTDMDIDITFTVCDEDAYIGGLFGKIRGTSIIKDIIGFGEIEITRNISAICDIYYGEVYGNDDDFIGTLNLYYAFPSSINTIDFETVGVFEHVGEDNVFIHLVEYETFTTNDFYTNTLGFDPYIWDIHIEEDSELPTLIGVPLQAPIEIVE